MSKGSGKSSSEGRAMDRHAIDPVSLIDQKIDWHLKNWAQWMRGYQVGIGYDHASAVVSSTASQTFDDMVVAADRQNAKVADACISSLPPIYQGAIYNVYLASVFRFRGDPNDVFVAAANAFWELAQKKGLY